MNKIFNIPIFIMLILCCSNNNDFVLYKTNTNIFTFKYPKNWKVSELNKLSILCKSQENKYYPPRFSLFVQIMPRVVNLEEYKSISIKQMDSLHPDLKLLKSDNTIFLNKKAMLLEMKYSNEGDELRATTIYCIEDNITFIFIAIALDSQWESALPIFINVYTYIKLNNIFGSDLNKIKSATNKRFNRTGGSVGFRFAKTIRAVRGSPAPAA